MKRLLPRLLPVAIFVLSFSACVPKPATDVKVAPTAPEITAATQVGEVPRPRDVPMTDATAAQGELAPDEALKIMLLQLLVAR
jgi:hypothetical protein